jgi:putative redox protein
MPDTYSGVVVTDAGPGRLAQDVVAGRHRLVGDEPVAAGGEDAGPTPYDYLLVALGTCTSMTVRLYADRKGWPLERIVVRLRHGKVHAQDCAECETREGRLDLIEREVELVGPLDEAQRTRLLDIAQRCPVHRTLASEIVIRTQLSSPGSPARLPEN